MGTATRDTHTDHGGWTREVVEAAADEEVGASQEVATGGDVVDPKGRAGPWAGADDQLDRLGRWADGRSVVAAIAVGVFVGAGWGIVARAWMRLITEHPEFSWSGTLYIVGAPAVIGAVVALAHVAVARQWRAAMVLRVPAVMVHVLLGAGAGSLLLPTLVFGSIALARRRFGVVLRIALGLLILAVGIPGGVQDGGSSMAAGVLVAGVALAVLVVSGWRTRVVLGTLAVLTAMGVSATVLVSDISLVRAALGSLIYLPLVAVPTLTAASLLRPREATPVAVSGGRTEAAAGVVAETSEGP
jgi:hypothetical protein